MAAPPRGDGWLRRSTAAERGSAGSTSTAGTASARRTCWRRSGTRRPGRSCSRPSSSSPIWSARSGSPRLWTGSADYRLLCIDEFELDDPGDTVLVSTLLSRLVASGVRVAATSNTLPDALGEGRFAADDFLREIQALAAAVRRRADRRPGLSPP